MLEPIRGITICVGYDDLLKITLPANARHLTEILVVTSPEDERTLQVVKQVPSARAFCTDAFYRHGAKFNKGLAMEEGFDELGRQGWILIWDADTLFPDHMDLSGIQIGNLYSPHRRIQEDPRSWDANRPWHTLPLGNDQVFAGYFQLFHANDPVLTKTPWYDVTFNHAGGCDGYFQRRWPESRKIRPSFEVLHFGPRDTNWFGRVSPRLDGLQEPDVEQRKRLMDRYLEQKGWKNRHLSARRRGLRRHPTVSDLERIHVPGAKPTDFIP